MDCRIKRCAALSRAEYVYSGRPGKSRKNPIPFPIYWFSWWTKCHPTIYHLVTKQKAGYQITYWISKDHEIALFSVYNTKTIGKQPFTGVFRISESIKFFKCLNLLLCLHLYRKFHLVWTNTYLKTQWRSKTGMKPGTQSVWRTIPDYKEGWSSSYLNLSNFPFTRTRRSLN